MKTIFFVLLALLSIPNSVFSQSWDNAFNQGGTYKQYGIGTARDASANRIVAGSYETGTATFGAITLANGGGYDGFIAKYNSANVIQWALRMSGTGACVVKSVTTDPSGNIYACGFFSGSCAFYNTGGALMGTLNTGNNSLYDGFLVKYNSAGTLMPWLTKVAFTSASEEIVNVEYRSSILAITGGVGANTTASGFPLLTGAYVASINPATGAIVWIYNCATNSGGGVSPTTAKNGLCIDNNNNIYIMSQAGNGAMVFGSPSGIVSSITLSSNTTSAPMYAKYSGSGNLLWARIGSGSIIGTAGAGLAITADDNNNVYIGGRLNPTGVAGQVLFPTSGVPLGASTSSATNCYIGKIDAANGNALWITTQNSITSVDLATQNCGVLYAALACGSSAVIHGTGGGSITPATTGLHIAKLYSTGQLLSNLTWDIAGTGQSEAYLNYWNNSLDVVSSILGSTTLPLTAGGTVTLTPTVYDMVAGTITEANPFPDPAISIIATPAQICSGQPVTFNTTVSGIGSYTYSWNVYSGGTFVPFPGSINSPTLPLTFAQYSPYIYFNPGLNCNVCAFQVVVTNCSGISYTAIMFFIVYSPITYTPVSDQSTCQDTEPHDAVFTVSAANVWHYDWEVSCDGGATWTSCSTNPTLYPGYNTASLTVHFPNLSMNGCLFHCILDGNFCSDVTTNDATLSVILGCRLMSPFHETTIIKANTDPAQLSCYPNPANNSIKLVLSGMEKLNEEAANMEISDMRGRIVMKHSLTANETILPTEGLPDGIYVITIKTTQHILSTKLVVTH